MTAPKIRPHAGWPREFTATVEGITVHQLCAIRDTPPGMGAPWCVICGTPQPRAVHVHHRLFKSRMGDGRPSNGLVVCPEGFGEGCHKTAIHDHAKTSAAAQGWAISGGAPRPACYRTALLCAWRGWIVLLDKPHERTGQWWRPANENDMAA